MSSDTQEYIDESRARIDAQVSAYATLAAAANGNAAVESALASFEADFFNDLVLVLEGSFVHRARGMEKKDGNSFNGGRLLCTSLLEGGGVLVPDKQIRLKPETSVLGLRVGDPIAIGETDFRRLADAFFAEIEENYGSGWARPPGPALGVGLRRRLVLDLECRLLG